MMTPFDPTYRVLLLAVTLLTFVFRADSFAQEAEIERGRYLTYAGGCVGCHTDAKGKGEPLAGGHGVKTPFGVFYSPNITPDPETGIGRWSDVDFVRALRQGLSPEGDHYFPVFPYTTYTKMREEDALAIKAYLFSLEPVSRQNREHDVSAPYGWRWTVGGWKLLYFEEGELAPDPDRDAVWNRGAYLVEALAHCGECHTPRNAAGALDRSMWMAGTPDGPEGEVAPNITPHGETGIGGWSVAQMTHFLKTGVKPDWENAKGTMAQAVNGGLRHLTEEDHQAIARYMASLPAINNRVIRR